MNHILLLFVILLATPGDGYCQFPIDSSNVKSKTVDEGSMEDRDAYPDFQWINFLNKQIDYSIATFNHAPIGVYRIIVGFSVMPDGSLANIEALIKRGYGMEREVIKALKKSPKWKPAIQNGKTIQVYRTQEVRFDVDYNIVWD